MKSYTVKALAVSGPGNKIFRSGDVVTEKNFPEGNADMLVKKGFLTEIKGELIGEKATVTDNSVVESVNEGKKFSTSEGVERQVKSIDEISKSELIKELSSSNVVFDSASKKGVLFDQWMKL